MARVPSAANVARPGVNLLGAPRQTAKSITPAAMGAGVAKAAAGFADKALDVAVDYRELRRKQDLGRARNELLAELPAEYQSIVSEEKEKGVQGLASRVRARLEAAGQARVKALGERYEFLGKSDIETLRAPVLSSANAHVRSAETFEITESSRLAVLEAEKSVEEIKKDAMRDPSMLAAARERAAALYENIPHLPESKRIEAQRDAARGVTLAALQGRIDRAPGALLADLKAGKVDTGPLTANDVSRVRAAAERRLRAAEALAERWRRKNFAKFRSDLAIGLSRGELSQADVEKAFTEGKITANERTQYILLADRREKATAAIETARSKEEIRATLDDAVRKGAGDPTAINMAFRMGAISSSERNSYLTAIDKIAKEREKEERRVERGRVAATGQVPLDPTSAEDRKAGEAYFERDIAPKVKALQESGDRDGARQLIVDFAHRSNLVPEAVKTRVQAQLRSGKPEARIAAADTIDRIVAERPKLAEQFRADDVAFAGHVMRAVRNGVDRDKAIEQAHKLIYERNEPVTKERKAEYARRKDDFETENRGIIESEFQRGAWGQLTGQRVVDLSAMQAEFNALVERRYLLSGDIEAARAQALAAMKSVWGVTGIGPRRLMRRPPEHEYEVPGVDSDWMREQLRDDLAGVGIVIPKTRVKVKAGLDPFTVSRDKFNERVVLALPPDQQRAEKPKYMVLIRTETGELVPLRRPLTAKRDPGGLMLWAPDWERSAEKARLEEKHKRELTRSLERARETRERLEQFEVAPGVPF